MKILAIEKEMPNVNWDTVAKILEEEARHVYQLYLSGYLREIYFTQDKNAVLILECENRTAVKDLLKMLPLVRDGLIDFDVLELHPYTGLSRLIKID